MAQPGFIPCLSIYSLAVKDNYVFAGTLDSGVLVTSDNGASWIGSSWQYQHNRTVYSFAVMGNYIFNGSRSDVSSGVYYSTNNGLNWIQSGLNNQTVYSLAVSGNILLAGTKWNGVYVSFDTGSTWMYWSEGLNFNKYIYALYVFNNYVFAGTDSCVFRRPLSELTGIMNIEERIPVKFSLYQNYPNPFNPSTTIEFALPKSSNVKLVVYDITGKEVEIQAYQQLQAGSYKVNFDGSNLSSSVYFYRLITNEFTETKKMVLVK